MLFFLTGDVQTGKTRWLQQLVDDLRSRGVETYGVLAPGTWIEHRDAADAKGRFEKTGIDNLLLPEGRLVPFARRRDLAQDAGSYDSSSQSGRANLAWAIDDQAIELVNGHLANVLARTSNDASLSPGLLVIDELGQLELRRGEGLTAAMELIDRGAISALPHALVIVRRQLLDIARERFAQAPWGELCAILPDEHGRSSVFASFGK